MGKFSVEAIDLDISFQGPGIAERVTNFISNIAERELLTPEP